MSCGTCAERTRQGAAAASGAPRATGAATTHTCPRCNWPLPATGRCVNPRCESGESSARSLVSRDNRQQIWQQTAACPRCGAFASHAGEPCPICHDTGQVEWDGETSPPGDLRARVLAKARQGADSRDGNV